ncbi:hypothetical protein L6164_031625 [Bauhinia variegata]|uniref:Uncharacterized protein n=1 Tax=Bauhinia variegata TaxID=167791 RepID=A0ACB9LGF3_BAUVA|nr:hypothetical protein L6164_031625 [Bauhinia variegata]
MHDMLQEMGKNIVIHEYPNDVGKRSRLWLQEDVDHVLAKNRGTEAIQGIVLNSWRRYKAHCDPDAFSKMCNLKVLKIYSFNPLLGLSCFSEGLRYLEWQGFPLKELPLGVKLDELVELRMHHSKIKQLWHGETIFRKLKVIDLKFSKDLIQFPSVSRVSYLEHLVLEGCTNLLEVDQSVGLHKKLIILNLRDCVNLKILPKKLEMDSLKELILSGCSKVKRLPEFGDNMELLTELNLQDCKSLVSLPKSIHKLKSLRILNTLSCSNLTMLPENLDKNEALEELNVCGTAIREVPPSIVHLKYLRKLSLSGQREMESNSWNIALPFQWIMPFRHPVSMGMTLPPVSRFSFLEELDLSYCNLRDESLPLDLGCLSSLEHLDLSGNNFTNLPANYMEEIVLHGNHYLCDFFASHQQMRRWYGPFFIIPGNEIPPWFSNQNSFHMEIRSPFPWETVNRRGIVDTRRRILPSVCDSLISIIVDIPHYCLSSEWWGIAVCLALENQFSCRWDFDPLYWICKTPEAELPVPSGNIHPGMIEEFSDPHLCILLLSGDERNIQRHLSSGSNQIQLLFFAEATPYEDDDIDDPGMLNISKCGYRLLCKEDLEVWGKATRERKQSNNLEIPSSSLNSSRITEIVGDSECHHGFDGESANTSNAESKRRKLR